MADDLDTGGDISDDTSADLGSDTSSDIDADFGGELSDDDGADLSDDINLDDSDFDNEDGFDVDDSFDDEMDEDLNDEIDEDSFEGDEDEMDEDEIDEDLNGDGEEDFPEMEESDDALPDEMGEDFNDNEDEVVNELDEDGSETEEDLNGDQVDDDSDLENETEPDLTDELPEANEESNEVTDDFEEVEESDGNALKDGVDTETVNNDIGSTDSDDAIQVDDLSNDESLESDEKSEDETDIDDSESSDESVESEEATTDEESEDLSDRDDSERLDESPESEEDMTDELSETDREPTEDLKDYEELEASDVDVVEDVVESENENADEDSSNGESAESNKELENEDVTSHQNDRAGGDGPCPVCGQLPCICVGNDGGNRGDNPPDCPVCGQSPCVCDGKRNDFKHWINPENYKDGKYTGDYEPSGMSSDEFGKQVDEQARDSYANHLKKQHMPRDEKNDAYAEFVDRQKNYDKDATELSNDEKEAVEQNLSSEVMENGEREALRERFDAIKDRPFGELNEEGRKELNGISIEAVKREYGDYIPKERIDKLDDNISFQDEVTKMEAMGDKYKPNKAGLYDSEKEENNEAIIVTDKSFKSTEQILATVMHEELHLLSQKTDDAGNPIKGQGGLKWEEGEGIPHDNVGMNEGVTELFATRCMQTLNPEFKSDSYKDQVDIMSEYEKACGAEKLKDAFFNSGISLLKQDYDQHMGNGKFDVFCKKLDQLHMTPENEKQERLEIKTKLLSSVNDYLSRKTT